MILQGRIEKGVVVLERTGRIPDGTPVTVIVPEPRDETERSQDAHRLRALASMDRIAGMPLEGNGGFSAKDHDKALYGKP